MSSALPQTMRAVQVSKPGGPDALEFVTRPLPAYGPTDVLVQMRAVGTGGPDVLIRNGTYKWMPPLPAIPGNEMAGVIVAVGSQVDPSRIGERVYVSSRELPFRGGCYAEYIAVPADAPFSLPPEVTDAQACSLGNAQMAQAMLLGANPGAKIQSILLPGAAGGVATALVQLARHHGITVIGTASTEEKRAHALAHGVNTLVDADPERLPAQVMEATQGRGVDVAYDHVGGALFIACIRSLAPFGTAVSYNIAGGPPSTDVFMELRAHLSKSLGIRTFSIHTFDHDRQHRRQLMEQAIELMRQGAVRAAPTRELPLEQAREVHEMLDKGAMLGKVVLVP